MSGSGQKVTDCDSQITNEDLEEFYKNYDPVPTEINAKIVKKLNARSDDKCSCLVRLNRKAAGDFEIEVMGAWR